MRAETHPVTSEQKRTLKQVCYDPESCVTINSLHSSKKAREAAKRAAAECLREEGVLAGLVYYHEILDDCCFCCHHPCLLLRHHVFPLLTLQSGIDESEVLKL